MLKNDTWITYVFVYVRGVLLHVIKVVKYVKVTLRTVKYKGVSSDYTEDTYR